MMLGGLLSLPGREDFDGIIKMLNATVGQMAGSNDYTDDEGNSYSSQGRSARIPSTKEILLRNPDLLSFGPTSTLSGLDVTSKFSAANVIPDDAVSAAFPFAGTIADIGGAAYDAVKNPGISSAMNLARNVSPMSSRFLHENYFKKGDMTLNPNTMEGQYRRKPFDEAARMGALRSVEESKAGQQSRTWKEQDMFFADKRSGIIKDAKYAAFEGNYEKLKQLAIKYSNNEGDVENFVSQVVDNIKEQHKDQVLRQIMAATKNPRKFNRMMGK
jgi:hypothetical protein